MFVIVLLLSLVLSVLKLFGVINLYWLVIWAPTIIIVLITLIALISVTWH